ncbi:flagellar hook-associated protein 2 [Marinobacterium nitratireducens]|uniref:Flagellar hook-associated protein 2 n=1 Tax=Marinobacterium nitratireducens TaxID=518897 RepID=A0A917ZK16_9GAMM|nr:flagellar filament capping protein FliD [Marinobacterium nitratireducens]GGO84932.1 flagellar hook-associated protein 2 [Marinobacterium nitratireducens]
MANITFSGIGSSLDTQAIVNAIVQAEIQPQRQLLSDRKSAINSQLSAMGKLKSALEGFQKVLEDLKSPDKFQARSVSVGNEDLLSVSASGSAVPGRYSVQVERLAEQHKLITAAGSFSSSSDAVGTGSLSISAGDNSFTVDIEAGKSSLADIRDAINKAADNDSVSATIVNVDDGSGGTEARLVLTSIDGGVANQISVSATDDDGNSSDASGLSQLSYDAATATGNMAEHQAAVDALIYVDGLAATRSTNSISDVIDGVTLDLNKAEPGTEITVDVGVDNDKIAENVQAFVDAYNNVRSIVKSTSENKDASALSGDATVRSIYNQMRALMSSPVTSASPDLNVLSLVGIEIDQYGTMSLDREKLDEKLDISFSAVSDLFASSDGMAARLDTLIDSYTEFKGLLENRTDGLNRRLDGISDAEERLDRREESMTLRLSRQYNAMDTLVGQLNSTGSYLAAQLASLNSSFGN